MEIPTNEFHILFQYLSLIVTVVGRHMTFVETVNILLLLYYLLW